MFRQVSPFFGALLLGLLGCGGSLAKAPESSGYPSAAFSSAAVGPSAQCPAGGIEVQSGVDKNGNGVLDASEVQSTQTICNGAPGPAGVKSLVRVTPESAGVHCGAGGLKVDSGLDLDGNGLLADSEVTFTSWVCNGAAPGLSLPVTVPLVLGPPDGAGVRRGAFAGAVGAGDALLIDGSRADALAVQVPAAGSLELVVDEPTMKSGAWLFTDACAANPDVSAWGPCLVSGLGVTGAGMAGVLTVEPGSYLLLLKTEPQAQPWESLSYSGTATFDPVSGAAGIPDAAYGAGGMAQFVASAAGYSPRDVNVSLDSQGRVLLGWWNEMGDGIARSARLTATGTLDTTWGGTGVVGTVVGTGSWIGQTRAPVEVAGGRVVVAAQASAKVVLLRYFTNGTPDTGFGAGGVVSTGISTLAWLRPVVAFGDGSLVIVGAAAANPKATLRVERYDAFGSLVAGYGTGGVTEVVVGESSLYVNSVVALADGSVIVVGESMACVDVGCSSTAYRAFAVKLGASGIPAAGFGTAGLAPLPFGEGVVIQNGGGGHLLVAGYQTTASGTSSEVRAARLLADGSVDATYGVGGVVSPPGAATGDGTGLAFDATGRLIVFGRGADPAPWLRRYLVSGALDLAFAAGGQLVMAGVVPNSLAIAGDGAIYAASTDGTNHLVQVQRIK